MDLFVWGDNENGWRVYNGLGDAVSGKFSTIDGAVHKLNQITGRNVQPKSKAISEVL